MAASHMKDDLAKSMIVAASHEQREALLAWAIELQSIRNSKVGAMAKARRAIKATAQRTVLAPLLKANLKRTKEMLWSERGWPARLVLVGLTVGTLGFSGKAAGLAAFGRAIAVPIWIVLAASGALLGVLIEELRALDSSPPTTTRTIIDAKQDGVE